MQKSLFDGIFRSIPGGGLTVAYWDGEQIAYGPEQSKFEIIFKNPPSSGNFAADPVLAFGECYMQGDIELKGDMDEMIRLMDSYLHHNTRRAGFSHKAFIAASKALKGLRDIVSQKKNIRAHYDLGNDFFSLWLDETMCYSSAYFKNPDDTLHQAQLNKIDLVLRKLAIKPGMRLLEIGCGWGWLSILAAKRYGAKVLGITLSEEQFEKASRRVADEGLSGQVEIRVQNYLELEPDKEGFDRITSIGMFEHVGREYIGEYLKKNHDLLVPGGVAMLHTLNKLKEGETNSWIKKYIFPGGYMPTLREIFTLLPEHGLSAVTVESLRRHYVRTLEIWHENFSSPAVLEKVERMFDDRFVRMWRLYLLSSAAALRCGSIDVHQILLSKGPNNDLPMTQETVYCN